MWLITGILAADTANGGTWATILAPALGAVAMIAVGVITQFGTLRTSSRTAAAQRDAALDERADRQYDRAQVEIKELRERCAVAERERDGYRVERDDYRERWTRLRLDILAAGIDPDNLTRNA